MYYLVKYAEGMEVVQGTQRLRPIGAGDKESTKKKGKSKKSKIQPLETLEEDDITIGMNLEVATGGYWYRAKVEKISPQKITLKNQDAKNEI